MDRIQFSRLAPLGLPRVLTLVSWWQWLYRWFSARHIDIMGWMLLCQESRPVCFRMFSSILAFYRQDAWSSTPLPHRDNPRYLQTLPSAGQNLSR